MNYVVKVYIVLFYLRSSFALGELEESFWFPQAVPDNEAIQYIGRGICFLAMFSGLQILQLAHITNDPLNSHYITSPAAVVGVFFTDGEKCVGTGRLTVFFTIRLGNVIYKTLY